MRQNAAPDIRRRGTQSTRTLSYLNDDLESCGDTRLIPQVRTSQDIAGGRSGFLGAGQKPQDRLGCQAAGLKGLVQALGECVQGAARLGELLDDA